MIPRYTPPEMGALWSDTHRIAVWLEVELAATDAMAAHGQIPIDDARALRACTAKIDPALLAGRALEIEENTKHDVIAFLSAFEEVAGPVSRHVHQGLTSSDVIDTAFALLLVEAARILDADIRALQDALRVRIEEHRHTPMIGRTHGIHAEPITFGLVLAGWYAELSRALRRLRAAREEIRVGKLSGAVGTSAHLVPEVETAALRTLGLETEVVATQVVSRDRHAMFFATLATIGASIERFALELRHLQRSEVQEAEEPFESGQKGSSAMPHKRNPILSENVCGLARLLRGYAAAAFEDVALWHERDISHSSVERVIAPDATTALSFMIRRMRRIVEGMKVYPENMRRNLDRMRGLVQSGTVLLRLTDKGLRRQEAYAIVQRAAMCVWDSDVDFAAALHTDAELSQHMSRAEIDGCFELARSLCHIDAIIDRALREP